MYDAHDAINNDPDQQSALLRRVNSTLEEFKQRANSGRLTRNYQDAKEITKLHKELESDQKNQIQRLTKENKELTKKEEEIVSKADSKVRAPKNSDTFSIQLGIFVFSTST